jgi:hypothetical protein
LVSKSESGSLFFLEIVSSLEYRYLEKIIIPPLPPLEKGGFPKYECFYPPFNKGRWGGIMEVSLQIDKWANHAVVG